MAMLSCTASDVKHWRELVKPALDDKAIDRQLYLQTYPDLAKLMDNPNLNHVRNNRAIRCQQLFRHAPKNLDATNNIQLPDGELTLNPRNPIFSRPGFERIPVEEMALYADAWRKLK
jgi:hypothetical protein